MKENLERLSRSKETNEFFTPIETIKKLLVDSTFKLDINKNYVEPCVGSGRILKVIKDNLISQGHKKEDVLKKLWGCDIILENCIQTIENVFEFTDIKVLSHIPEKYKSPGLKNIFIVDNKIFPHVVCADSMIYNLNFFGESVKEKFGNNLFEVL